MSSDNSRNEDSTVLFIYNVSLSKSRAKLLVSGQGTKPHEAESRWAFRRPHTGGRKFGSLKGFLVVLTVVHRSEGPLPHTHHH